MLIAQIIVWFLSIYVLLGLLFAPFFVTRGAAHIDPSVQQATWGFRLMIAPGVVALWPLLLRRWLRGVQHPPTETNAHRKAAQ
jgi:hypothetical protein